MNLELVLNDLTSTTIVNTYVKGQRSHVLTNQEFMMILNELMVTLFCLQCALKGKTSYFSSESRTMGGF